jgi:hypothetical protein
MGLGKVEYLDAVVFGLVAVAHLDTLLAELLSELGEQRSLERRNVSRIPQREARLSLDLGKAKFGSSFVALTLVAGFTRQGEIVYAV